MYYRLCCDDVKDSLYYTVSVNIKIVRWVVLVSILVCYVAFEYSNDSLGFYIVCVYELYEQIAVIARLYYVLVGVSDYLVFQLRNLLYLLVYQLNRRLLRSDYSTIYVNNRILFREVYNVLVFNKRGTRIL